MAGQRRSELTVIMKAKDLSAYIVTITQKSPKQFRFTFVSRMQNLSLDVIENIYLANETYLAEPRLQEMLQRRLDYQYTALTNIKLLTFVAEIAMEHRCILPKHFEQIAIKALECQRLLGAWINSDKRRHQN